MFGSIARLAACATLLVLLASVEQAPRALAQSGTATRPVGPSVTRAAAVGLSATPIGSPPGSTSSPSLPLRTPPSAPVTPEPTSTSPSSAAVTRTETPRASAGASPQVVTTPTPPLPAIAPISGPATAPSPTSGTRQPVTAVPQGSPSPTPTIWWAILPAQDERDSSEASRQRNVESTGAESGETARLIESEGPAEAEPPAGPPLTTGEPGEPLTAVAQRLPRGGALDYRILLLWGSLLIAAGLAIWRRQR